MYISIMCWLHCKKKAYLSIFVLFLVEISKKLLDKQNKIFSGFQGGKTKSSAFCLKQVKVSASGVSKIFQPDLTAIRTEYS